MGANIKVDGLSVTVVRSELESVDIAVPGDISGAAFWLVAGAIHPNAEIRLSGVGIKRDALRGAGGAEQDGRQHLRGDVRKRTTSPSPI